MRIPLPPGIKACVACIAAGIYVVLPTALRAQQPYKNIINQRFRTVGNGPQSALIVDVANDADQASVRAAVVQRYAAMRKQRDPLMQKELATMRRTREVKAGRQLDVVDYAIVRRGGTLMMKAPAGNAPIDKSTLVSRAAGSRLAGNSLTFTFPTTGTDSWSAAKAQQLNGLVNGLIPELTTVLGAPAWTGTVTVLNKDPYLGTVNEIIGALFMFDPGSSTYQIWMPTFSDPQTEFLAMAQTMAQAWHGPDLIGYDAWEKGMARAMAVIAAQDLKNYPGLASTPIDPDNGFYYTPDYDLLNQPALGNNTFMPPTKGKEPGPTVNLTQYGGMMIPRLTMSGSAWLKCYIDNPSFFSSFNAAYYSAFTADATVANDVNRLRELAASALPSGVEGIPFDTWYEQQFVLDTSITVGTKLYAHTEATFPDPTTNSPAGVDVFLIYYLTTSTGDEIDLNGICQVVYWDYSFSNRLTLPTFGSVTIADGFGAVAPYFQGIGGNPADQMRVAMDFPLNKEYVRVYFPAGQTGTLASPNTFSGVLVGQDSGTLAAQFTSGGSITTVNATVAQGAFGAAGNVGTGFSRTTLTVTQPGTTTLTFKRNHFVRNGDVAPTFQLAALGTTATLTNSFENGPQMISLPIRPLNTNMAAVLGADPALALIAQFRQDNTIGPDQYLRYPTLPAYQPGYGLWTDFPSITTPQAPGIVGIPYDPVSQPNVSIGLQFGWNQIGPPYTVPLNLNSDVQFQYLGGTVGQYSNAVTNGWIASGVIAFDPLTGYQDITNTTDTAIPLNTLSPWTGYWINVTVPEGITLTYMAPSSRAAATIRAAQANRSAAPNKLPPGSWKMGLQLSDGTHISTATIGEMRGATAGYKPAFDIASPPDAPGASPLKIRLPAKQGAIVHKGAPADMIADIRPTTGRNVWDINVSLPAGKQSYTISWNNTATLPRGTRLTLIDGTTGAQHVMNSGTYYTFQAGAGENTRAFQIVSAPRALSRLQVSNVFATLPRTVPGRAATSMTISFELSAAGQTNAEISLNGRVVRHLAQAGRAAESGVNQVVWDMRDDRGRAVAPGTYTIQILAQTADGEMTRSIVPLNVVR